MEGLFFLSLSPPPPPAVTDSASLEKSNFPELEFEFLCEDDAVTGVLGI